MAPVYLGVTTGGALKRSLKALDSVQKERKILSNQDRSHIKEMGESFCKNISNFSYLHGMLNIAIL
jgi:hypothetical protein